MPHLHKYVEPSAPTTARQRFGLTALVAIFSAMLITLSALSLFFVGGVASKTADKIAIEKQYVLFENALRDRQNLMARDQLGLARWDRSVKYVTLRFRETYVEEELVSSLWHDFGHERSFLVGPGGRLLMSAWQDQVDFTQRTLADGDSLLALVDLAIARHNTNRTTIEGGYGQRPVQASQVEEIAAFGFIEIDSEVMIASAMAIVPDDGEVALPDGPPIILVSARPVNTSFIDDINSQLKLTNVTFDRHGNGLIPVIDVEARTLGSFSWDLYLPGRDIWPVVVPLTFGLCGVMLIATLVLGRYIHLLSVRLEASERRNRDLAMRDALSGLANRLCFDQALNSASERLAHAPFAVIACDLDRFKAVNDVHGHAAGDEVIRVVAERLKEAVGDQGLVGRTGGDEFVILMSAFRDRARLALLAQHIITSISRPIVLPDGAVVDVGISLGIAAAPDQGISGREIMASADQALYASKEGGRGRAFFAEDLDEAARNLAGHAAEAVNAA
ncbi:diguanylate cyclase domain-containing protein [Rhizobium glycinendophyticum]|nr:diguanylate cyclase [Rhizobium glycinendophyticum]